MTPNQNAFFDAYCECAVWSSNTDGQEPEGYNIDDGSELAPETIEKMKADCLAFIAENSEWINYGDYSQAGHDFWLTRCGHGAGFWDGDWPELAGKCLTDASKRAGECWLYVGDDGLVYQD